MANIFDLPSFQNATTWDEVFNSENGQEMGWSRETVALTGAVGTYQIGTLVVLGADNKTATVPADFTALSGAGALKIAILGGKNIKPAIPDLLFNRDLVVLSATRTTEDQAVVVYDARNGGAIGDAEIKFPTGTTPAQKATIFGRLKAENGFKVMKQAVKG